VSLKKKERRIVIGIGLAIGVTVSSLLVRHAIDIKEEQAVQKPGSYPSQMSAVGNTPFPAVPPSIEKVIPNGIVVYYEANRTSLTGQREQPVNTWVIETTGSFRSERLFLLVEINERAPKQTQYFRASEIYVKGADDMEQEELENLLDEEHFRIIGQNQSSKEYIVQLRDFSPNGLSQSIEMFESLPMVKQVRMSPWVPVSKR